MTLDAKRTPMVRDTSDESYLRLGFPDGLRTDGKEPLTACELDGSSDLPKLNEKKYKGEK